VAGGGGFQAAAAYRQETGRLILSRGSVRPEGNGARTLRVNPQPPERSMSTVYPLDLQRRVDRIWATRMALSPDRACPQSSLASFGSESPRSSITTHSRHGQSNGGAMPSKKENRKRPTGDVSGVAITLFPLHDRIASSDNAEYRRKAGELIAGAARAIGKVR
jgi:hypothetical protein